MNAPITVDQYQRDLRQLYGEQRLEQKPNIAYLEQRVNACTAQALLDPSLKGELAVAMHNLQEAQQIVAANAERAARIATLERELEEATHQKRMDDIAFADKALQQASDEYLALGKQLIRSYRRLLQQQRRSSATPGARFTIPAGFNFAPANPDGWYGNTSDVMRDTLLPFEKYEQDREKVAA